MFKVFLTCCLVAAVVCAPAEEEIEGDGDEPFDFGTIRVQKMDAKTINIGGAFYVMRKVGNEISFQITLTDSVSKKQVMSVERPFCDLFARVYELFPSILESSSLPKDGSCPTTGVYTIDDLTVEDKAFDKIPPGEYELTMEVVDSSTKRTLVELETVGMFKF